MAAFACCALSVLAQSETATDYSGKWELVPERSQFASAHAPVAGWDLIDYDGVHWRLEQSVTGTDGAVAHATTELTVDSPRPHITKAGEQVLRSRLEHDGDALLLTEERVAADGKAVKRQLRYSLEDEGKTLVVADQENGAATSRWVFRRLTSASTALTPLGHDH